MNCRVFISATEVILFVWIKIFYEKYLFQISRLIILYRNREKLENDYFSKDGDCSLMNESDMIKKLRFIAYISPLYFWCDFSCDLFFKFIVSVF